VPTGTAAAGVDGLLSLLVTVPGRREDALAIANGLFGDALAERASRQAIPMTLRSGSEVLPLDRGGLAGALPDATGRIAVLVHGLMSTESVWAFVDDPATSYGTLLARDHGVTPLSLRYNTGRHISVNGRELARLLHRLVAAWPVRVREITLIGHSMGGLVIRSACHYASSTRRRHGRARFRRSWTSKVRRVVLVGVPNTGAPLEVFANLTSATLWSLPIPATRLVGLGLDTRSAGIKDLRFGAILDEDWQEQDPDARQRPVPHQVAPLRRAAYLIIAGSVTADPDHPLTRMIGDALVTSSSASGALDDPTGGGLFPGATVRLFPKTTHLALANRPEVYDAIDHWWPEPRHRATRQRPRRA
jgi:triacylglycerol lipase